MPAYFPSLSAGPGRKVHTKDAELGMGTKDFLLTFKCWSITSTKFTQSQKYQNLNCLSGNTQVAAMTSTASKGTSET